MPHDLPERMETAAVGTLNLRQSDAIMGLWFQTTEPIGGFLQFQLNASASAAITGLKHTIVSLQIPKTSRILEDNSHARAHSFLITEIMHPVRETQHSRLSIIHKYPEVEGHGCVFENAFNDDLTGHSNASCKARGPATFRSDAPCKPL